jgi:hypothetical protein
MAKEKPPRLTKPTVPRIATPGIEPPPFPIGGLISGVLDAVSQGGVEANASSRRRTKLSAPSSVFPVYG